MSLSVCNISENTQNNEGIEQFYPLLSSAACKLEKIVSYGQATQSGYWYNQDHDEWVMLVKGTAVLQIYPSKLIALNAGDFLTIPARLKHRVDKCSADAIWLALHLTP